MLFPLIRKTEKFSLDRTFAFSLLSLESGGIIKYVYVPRREPQKLMDEIFPKIRDWN